LALKKTYILEGCYIYLGVIGTQENIYPLRGVTFP
jgi:hypothetical protein